MTDRVLVPTKPRALADYDAAEADGLCECGASLDDHPRIHVKPLESWRSANHGIGRERFDRGDSPFSPSWTPTPSK